MTSLARTKTSVYIDKDLWLKFREYSHRKGLEVSKVFEDMMEDEMVGDIIGAKMAAMIGVESNELDFEPVKARVPSVSRIVRGMRDARASSLSRQ